LTLDSHDRALHTIQHKCAHVPSPARPSMEIFEKGSEPLGSFQNKFGVDFVVLKTGPDLVKTRVGKRWLPKYSTVSNQILELFSPASLGSTSAATKMDFRSRGNADCVSPDSVCVYCGYCAPGSAPMRMPRGRKM